jgi:hypothetical protein
MRTTIEAASERLRRRTNLDGLAGGLTT